MGLARIVLISRPNPIPFQPRAQRGDLTTAERTSVGKPLSRGVGSQGEFAGWLTLLGAPARSGPMLVSLPMAVAYPLSHRANGHGHKASEGCGGNVTRPVPTAGILKESTPN
jgi:hypothetical protein